MAGGRRMDGVYAADGAGEVRFHRRENGPYVKQGRPLIRLIVSGAGIMARRVV